MELLQDPLANINAPVVWIYTTIANLTLLEALPPAARERETKRAADTFASTGRNIFVHYVTPVLDERCKRLLVSGLRKKKYPKTGAQLWQSIGHDEQFYWNEAARSLRQSLKQGNLSPKGCLLHGGMAGQWKGYVHHAEVAVAAYLELPAPVEMVKIEEVSLKIQYVEKMPAAGDKISRAEIVGENQDFEPERIGKTNQEAARETAVENASSELDQVGTTVTAVDDNLDSNVTTENEDFGLLDTLPEPFEHDQKMLYSHFARYDYASIRNAEGKH